MLNGKSKSPNFTLDLIMQIVLLENILKLGKVGDLVKVKDGYGRNYLIKNDKALRANKENIDFVNKKKDELNKKNNR